MTRQVSNGTLRQAIVLVSVAAALIAIACFAYPSVRDLLRRQEGWVVDVTPTTANVVVPEGQNIGFVRRQRAQYLGTTGACRRRANQLQLLHGLGVVAYRFAAERSP